MNWRDITSTGPQGRLRRKLLLARAAMLAERLWHAVFPAVMLAGVMLLLVASGLLPALPGMARLLAWLAFVAGMAWLLRPLKDVRLPTEDEALARLEARSRLSHQPLRTLADDMAAPAHDAAAQALWKAHKQRIASHIRALRVGWPRSDAPRRDPFALRFALGLALVATFALNGPRFLDNLHASLRPPTLALAGEPARLDAWIDPPAFAGAPPVMLATNGKLLRTDAPVQVLQGARLTIRFQGRVAPEITLHATDSGGALLRREEPASVESGAWQARIALNQPLRVRIAGGGISASWNIDVLADAPPVIELEKPPVATASGALSLRWKAHDDHGVKAARAIIALAEPPAGMLRYDAPKAPLKLLKPGKQVRGQDMLKLMAHPWAGLKVRLTLEATDVGGQTGRSKPLQLTLPQRRFSQPLAAAIVEQRRGLILHPARRHEIAEVLAAFLAWPQGLLKRKASSAYLGLRHAMTSLLAARGEDDLKQVVALLWEVAQTIEDGDLADAKRQLEAARKALEEALKNGASEEEIARRMAELKQALNRYLQSLARQQMQHGQQQPHISRNGQMQAITPQDLQRMMDQLERLARSGARDAAQRMLSQLDNILQNLQTMPQTAMRPSPDEQALRELQKLMREQQKLLDETWRESQERRRQGDARGNERLEQLQRQQQALAEALRQMMERMQRQGEQPQGRQQQDGQRDGQQDGEQQRQGEGPDGFRPGGQSGPQGENRFAENGRNGSRSGGMADGEVPGDALGQAQRSMRGAARNLGQRRPGSAMRDQMQALQALRRGARQLARRIARQQGRQRGGVGIGMMRRQYDPLGRPLRGQFAEPGPDNPMVPDLDAAQRARRILEYLRKRAEDATRPPLERNYIDRLLRGLY